MPDSLSAIELMVLDELDAVRVVLPTPQLLAVLVDSVRPPASSELIDVIDATLVEAVGSSSIAGVAVPSTPTDDDDDPAAAAATNCCCGWVCCCCWITFCCCCESCF